MAAARILVIDDNDGVRRALRRWLEPHATVDTAASIDEAMAHIAVDPAYDHILCDLVMPGGSGETFFELLTDRAPQLTRRLTFVSGGASQSLLDFVARTGRPLVEKPFDVRALVERILGVREAS